MTRMANCWALVCLLGLTSLFQKANGCTLCASVKLVSTFREDFSNPLVNLIATGRLGKATLNPDGTGMTEFEVGQILRQPKGWVKIQNLSIEKYLPGGEKNSHSTTALLGNWNSGRLIPMRAIRLESNSSLQVIQNQVTQNPTPSSRFLTEIFPRLSLAEPELAADAFMEWAKADDSLVTVAGKSLPPAVVRTILQDPATPTERLGLLSFLLGCCGNPEKDCPLIEKALLSEDSRWRTARDGLLAGLVLLNPSLGWKTALESISSIEKPLQERLATLRALKMIHATGLREYENFESREMVETFEKALGQKDIADIAIDYLRTWKQARLEKQVLSSFPPKGEGPLLSRSVLQFALTFRNRPACAEFLKKVEINQPELIREMEDLYGFSP